MKQTYTFDAIGCERKLIRLFVGYQLSQPLANVEINGGDNHVIDLGLPSSLWGN